MATRAVKNLKHLQTTKKGSGPIDLNLVLEDTGVVLLCSSSTLFLGIFPSLSRSSQLRKKSSFTPKLFDESSLIFSLMIWLLLVSVIFSSFERSYSKKQDSFTCYSRSSSCNMELTRDISSLSGIKEELLLLNCKLILICKSGVILMFFFLINLGFFNSFSLKKCVI